MKSTKTKKHQQLTQKKPAILEVKNAGYRYADAAEDEYALRNVNLSFEKGKTYAIRGRSGSGKTTLLSLITGLERATEGEIVYDGKKLSETNLDDYRSREIGIVFQSYNLLPHLTAAENIILSMDLSGKKYDNPKEKAIELMKKVGLKDSYANRKVLRLSGGEQQRVAIARSLSYEPKLIIADEPTGNLDKKTEDEIMKIFDSLAHQDGKCIIIVTHSPEVAKRVDKIFDLKSQR